MRLFRSSSNDCGSIRTRCGFSIATQLSTVARHTDQSYQVKKHFITSLFKQTQYNIPITDRIQRIVATSTADIKSFHHKFLLNGDSTYVTMITPTVEAASILGNIFPVHENTARGPSDGAHTRAFVDKHW